MLNIKLLGDARCRTTDGKYGWKWKQEPAAEQLIWACAKNAEGGNAGRIEKVALSPEYSRGKHKNQHDDGSDSTYAAAGKNAVNTDKGCGKYSA